MLEVTGSKSELRFVDLPVDDPTRRCPDITKARTLLGWEPRVRLKEGLAKSLEFFRSQAAMQRSGGIRVSVGRLVGFGAQQIAEDVALVRRELVLVARRVEHRGALIERHGAQILEGALDQ